MKEINVLEFITTLRASFGSSIATYTQGNCYQFYEILKVVFPDAEAYETGGHVVTKINREFYDIKGKMDKDKYHVFPLEDDRIDGLCVNKWTDERRKEYAKEVYKEQLEKLDR
jgi:hypothetical protein